MLQEALFDFLHPDKPQSKCKLNAGGVSCLLPICYMFDRKMNLHARTIWFFKEKKGDGLISNSGCYPIESALNCVGNYTLFESTKPQANQCKQFQGPDIAPTAVYL